MGLVLAITAGLVAWIVLWSLDVKAIDGFILATVIIATAAGMRMVTRFIPGREG